MVSPEGAQSWLASEAAGVNFLFFDIQIPWFLPWSVGSSRLRVGLRICSSVCLSAPQAVVEPDGWSGQGPLIEGTLLPK